MILSAQTTVATGLQTQAITVPTDLWLTHVIFNLTMFANPGAPTIGRASLSRSPLTSLAAPSPSLLAMCSSSDYNVQIRVWDTIQLMVNEKITAGQQIYLQSEVIAGGAPGQCGALVLVFFSTNPIFFRNNRTRVPEFPELEPSDPPRISLHSRIPFPPADPRTSDKDLTKRGIQADNARRCCVASDLRRQRLVLAALAEGLDFFSRRTGELKGAVGGSLMVMETPERFSTTDRPFQIRVLPDPGKTEFGGQKYHNVPNTWQRGAVTPGLYGVAIALGSIVTRISTQATAQEALWVMHNIAAQAATHPIDNCRSCIVRQMWSQKAKRVTYLARTDRSRIPFKGNKEKVRWKPKGKPKKPRKRATPAQKPEK